MQIVTLFVLVTIGLWGIAMGFAIAGYRAAQKAAAHLPWEARHDYWIRLHGRHDKAKRSLLGKGLEHHDAAVAHITRQYLILAVWLLLLVGFDLVLRRLAA